MKLLSSRRETGVLQTQNRKVLSPKASQEFVQKEPLFGLDVAAFDEVLLNKLSRFVLGESKMEYGVREIVRGA